MDDAERVESTDTGIWVVATSLLEAEVLYRWDKGLGFKSKEKALERLMEVKMDPIYGYQFEVYQVCR